MRARRRHQRYLKSRGFWNRQARKRLNIQLLPEDRRGAAREAWYGRMFVLQYVLAEAEHSRLRANWERFSRQMALRVLDCFRSLEMTQPKENA